MSNKFKRLRQFIVNGSSQESKPEKIMIQCKSLLKKDAVRRETIDGVEHIIVSSSTLPDDIVMNGGLYPADEIAKSFESLEMTLAPLGHPHINGEFLSATDPRAIHEFHAGAFNVNVRQEGGRIHIDKFINVQEALKTNRGKRLLDRIEELETNEKARPIHTSVGVYLVPEMLEQPVTNAEGVKYDWIARDMAFDHDAILIDEVGAAQPGQGVGMAVNLKGEKFSVSNFDLEANEQSVSEQDRAVRDALDKGAIKYDWIEELFSDHVIFSLGDDYFDVPYVIDSNDLATIVGIPLLVDRNVTYTPKVNQQQGDKMKELIINALKEAGVKVDGLSDEQLFEAYGKLNVSSDEPAPKDDPKDDPAPEGLEGVAEIIANALKPMAEQIASLQAGVTATEEAEVDKLATLVANSGKYPLLDADSAKLLGVVKLKEMAANCSPAFGVSPLLNNGQKDDFAAPVDMPK